MAQALGVDLDAVFSTPSSRNRDGRFRDLDIEAEYKLIQAKKSSYSASDRNAIVRMYESTKEDH